MLVNLQTILSDTRAKKYAVGSFNVYSYETIKGVFESMKELQRPAIVAFGEKYLENMDFEIVADIVKYFGNKTHLPVVLHLDHCKETKNIYKAAKAGFTSVMYDGSAYGFGQNVKNTREVTQFAHACDISVEAELGSLAAGIKSHEGEQSDREIYTDPNQAADFVTQTQVDALAVSIGTVHGLYKGIPKIRVDILKEIKEKVSIPLVLHGGSGTPEDIIRDCIANGICKINVNTEISEFSVQNMKEILNSNTHYHLSTLSLKEIDYVKQVVMKYSTLFGEGR
jgi:fructose-bisphosphate aldolase class II